jgi:hypothetical protein
MKLALLGTFVSHPLDERIPSAAYIAYNNDENASIRPAKLRKSPPSGLSLLCYEILSLNEDMLDVMSHFGRKTANGEYADSRRNHQISCQPTT